MTRNAKTSADASDHDGWLAVWSNSNGNVAVAALVFSSVSQAHDWARRWLLENGCSRVKVTGRGTLEGKSANTEMTFTFVPTLLVEPDRAPEDISFDHLHSLR